MIRHKLLFVLTYNILLHFGEAYNTAIAPNFKLLFDVLNIELFFLCCTTLFSGFEFSVFAPFCYFVPCKESRSLAYGFCKHRWILTHNSYHFLGGLAFGAAFFKKRTGQESILWSYKGYNDLPFLSLLVTLLWHLEKFQFSHKYISWGQLLMRAISHCGEKS